MNRIKILLGLALASLILYGVFKIIMFLKGDDDDDKEDDDKNSGDSSVGTSESGNETPPGGDSVAPPVSGGGGTTESGGEVSSSQNATCSSVPAGGEGGCPTGYIKKTDSDSIQCSSTTCDVSLDGTTKGVDLDTCCLKWNCTDPFSQGNPPDGYIGSEAITYTSPSEVSGISCDSVSGYYQLLGGINATCGDDSGGSAPNFILSGCEQGCNQPSGTTGYTNLPTTLPVVSGTGTIPGAGCASNYHSAESGIQYTCSAAGEVYSLSGCAPDQCTTPDTPDTTGYNITGVTNLERRNFPVDVTCAPGYGSDTEATAQAEACRSHGETYTLTGCGDKTGFCSGNTSAPDFTCGNGYSDKLDKSGTVGDSNELCCDKTGFCSGNTDSRNDFTCGIGYSDKLDKSGTVGDSNELCCDPWTCMISGSDRELYNIQVGSNPITGNNIPYTDIGSSSTSVACAEDAQSTGDISIQACSNNGGNVILSGCEPAPVTAPVTAQVSESGDTGDSEERSEEPEPEGDNNYWYIAYATGRDDTARARTSAASNCTQVCISYNKVCDTNYWGNELTEIISGEGDIPWGEDVPQTIRDTLCTTSDGRRTSSPAHNYAPYYSIDSGGRCYYPENTQAQTLSNNNTNTCNYSDFGKARICKCIDQ